MMGAAGRRNDLTVINPSAILGPLLDDDPGTSGELVVRALRGKLPAAPRIALPSVDVRDVAEAHLRAMTAPEAGGQRYPISQSAPSLIEAGAAIGAAVPQFSHRMPKLELPDWFIRLVALFSLEMWLPVQQNVIQVAPAPSSRSDLRFGAEILSSIVGDDGGSRIYWARVDPGLVEFAELGYYDYDGSGTYMTWLCCQPETVAENVARIHSIYDKVNQDGVTLFGDRTVALFEHGDDQLGRDLVGIGLLEARLHRGGGREGRVELLAGPVQAGLGGDPSLLPRRRHGLHQRRARVRLGRLGETDHAVEAVVIGDRQRLVAECGGRFDEFLGMGRAAQERKITERV